MRYVGKVYRPPSEADALIVQATIGCSWNHCTYCDMYRDKPRFAVRPLAETLADLAGAGRAAGDRIDKVFVADGDALVLPMELWIQGWPLILESPQAGWAERQFGTFSLAQGPMQSQSLPMVSARAWDRLRC